MRGVGNAGVAAKRRPRGKPGGMEAPNLARRDFTPTAPDQLWVADITYVATWEGWLFLAVLIDAFSRRCVGWSMRDDLQAELVIDALQMAVTRRRAEGGLVNQKACR